MEKPSNALAGEQINFANACHDAGFAKIQVDLWQKNYEDALKRARDSNETILKLQAAEKKAQEAAPKAPLAPVPPMTSNTATYEGPI